jgi:hypothetical protein
MAKRGGSAHLTQGIVATAEGSLAIDCPACPHPGLNAPTCLDEMPEERRLVDIITAVLTCITNTERIAGSTHFS